MTCSSPLGVYGRQAEHEVSRAMESAGARDPNGGKDDGHGLGVWLLLIQIGLEAVSAWPQRGE
jgi:hypothetical protein